MRGCGANGLGWVVGVELQISFTKATIYNKGRREKEQTSQKRCQEKAGCLAPGARITAGAYYAITAR